MASTLAESSWLKPEVISSGLDLILYNDAV